MRYLSPTWIEALDEAARSVTGDGEALPDVVLQQRIRDEEDRTVAYRIEVEGGRVRVRPGAVEDPDVQLTCDRITARDIARGTLSAQQAFLDGRLRIGGRVATLVEHRPLWAHLGEALARVRDRTDW